MQRRKISLLCILICSLPIVLFAADDNGDCGLFVAGAEKGVIRSPYDTIYPQKNVDIAINNLKNYCCNNKLIVDMDICKDVTDTEGAPSSILYDHIIDVGFRSLDGDKDLYYTKPNTQIGDQIGEEWKKKITEYATNAQGAIPIKIRGDFGRYRGFDMQGGVKADLNEQTDCNKNQQQYIQYEKNRNKNPTSEQDSEGSLGLAQKYLIVCHIAQCISYKNISNYYQSCKNIALERIHDEMDYVQITTINQGLAGLVGNFNAYAQGYFVQGQLSQLLEKITEMNAGLTHINSKVSEMTRTCSI